MPDEQQLTNRADRDNVIREAARRCADYQSQIDDLMVPVKDLRKEYREYDKTVMARLGYSSEDWRVVMALYRADHLARADTLDTLRECFAALKIGDQLDFVSALQTAVPQAATAEEQHEQGRAAGRDGKTPAIANPFPFGTDPHIHWRDGWMEGQKELAAKVKPMPMPASSYETETGIPVVVRPRRGRPPGAKDLQPRRRSPRAAADALFR
jgi:hypothetical protein